MNHASIIAILKKKKPQHNFGTIYIRGFFKGKPVAAVSTGHKILCAHWDLENRRIHDKAPNAKLLNAAIDMKLQELKAGLLQAEIMGVLPNRKTVGYAVKGVDAAKDFFSFSYKIIQLNYTNKETIRTYKSELAKISKFESIICFADIDFDFLQRYRFYMRGCLANTENTIWKTFKFIKTIFAYAKKQGGIIAKDPFEEFDRGKYVQTQRTFLTIDECNSINNLINNESVPVILRRISIYFLLMCYSGLRYEDAISFNPAEHIINDERIIKKTSKGNGTIINIKLYGRLREIVNLVKQFPLKVSNKEFNKYLMAVAMYAGINKKITCHVGRHTFGSFLPDAGVSKEAAQRLLGHADQRSTNVYYHIKEKNVDDAADKLNNL